MQLTAGEMQTIRGKFIWKPLVAVYGIIKGVIWSIIKRTGLEKIAKMSRKELQRRILNHRVVRPFRDIQRVRRAAIITANAVIGYLAVTSPHQRCIIAIGIIGASTFVSSIFAN